jgi:hypothetical protein
MEFGLVGDGHRGEPTTGVGTLSAQRVEWLGGSNLPGFSTTHFEVPIRQQASRYRVSVFAFDFAQAARIESP